jgi:hypothetical protein
MKALPEFCAATGDEKLTGVNFLRTDFGMMPPSGHRRYRSVERDFPAEPVLHSGIPNETQQGRI